MLRARTVVAVMPNDLPVEQRILHLRAASDVMNHHVTPPTPPLVHNNADVGNAASQVPSHNIPRRVVLGASTGRKLHPIPRKEHHQVGDSPVINVAVWLPLPFVRVSVEIAH